MSDPAPEPATEADRQVNVLVDSVDAIFDLAPDDAIANSLISDIAQNIHPPEQIAARYGMTPRKLLEFLAIPEVRRRTKQRRAQWESGEAVQVRARTYAGHVVIEALPELDRLIHDSHTAAAVKLDAFKAASKVAGLESVGRGMGDNAPSTAPFAVNIMFSSGEMARITTVGPTVESNDLAGNS